MKALGISGWMTSRAGQGNVTKGSSRWSGVCKQRKEEEHATFATEILGLV